MSKLMDPARKEPVARAADTLTYVGTLDDQVLQYPWPGIPIQENFLIDTIIDHVLFGMPMLINDGYLVNHPLARADLLKGKESLILTLVQKGFIKVLTRVGDLDDLKDMPRQMARVGVGSFPARITEDDPKRLEYALGELGDSLRPHYNCYRWPRVDMGDGFAVLIDNIRKSIKQKGFASLGFASANETFVQRQLYRISNRLAKDTAAARTHFETYLNEAAADLPNDEAAVLRTDLMGLANEIYHFNFGIHMDRLLRPDGLKVITETRLSRAFDDLLSVEEQVIALPAPLPLVGRPGLVTTLDPQTLAAIIDPTTRVGSAKVTFQRLLRKFAQGEYTVEEAQDFAQQYEKALIAHFTARTTPRTLKVAVTATMILSPALMAVGLPAGGPTTALTEGASDVTMGGLSSFVGEPWLMRVAQRYRRRKMAGKFKASKVPLSPHLERALLSNIRFNREVIDPIAERVKTF